MNQQTPEEFLEHLFLDSYCEECGGDEQHHVVVSDFPFPGTFFAACKFPRDDKLYNMHPVIVAFRKERGLEIDEFLCCDNCDRVGPSDTFVHAPPSSYVGEAILCAKGQGCNP